MKPPKQTDLMRSPRSVREWCMWASLEITVLDARMRQLRQNEQTAMRIAGEAVDSTCHFCDAEDRRYKQRIAELEAEVEAEVERLKKLLMRHHEANDGLGWGEVCPVCAKHEEE